MKTKMIRLAAGAVIGSALLAACGGGDDDLSGGATAFSIVPTETTLTGPTGFCPGAGFVQTVQIIGGAPPYRILSTSPALTVSTDRVDNQGGTFDITFNGGCFENQQVTIRDTFNRFVTFSGNGEKGS
jgi:hypothetical protein